MLFGRFLSGTAPALVGQRLYLRQPLSADFETWAALRAVSRGHLQPWEPSWAEDALSRDGFRRRLAWFEKIKRQESGEAFFLFARRDDSLLGGITLSNIRRGAAQCGELGYWIGQPYAGQGLMGEALRLMMQHCFGGLNLHRLEAATLPENVPSQRLLLRAGFQAEGIARQFLKINGVWRDHRMYGRLADDPGL
ncbi:GNAT family N-acetyltransferase [Ferrovibrio sp.]|uniref:GNAT family N-acetyltransferase n=1 Tax=Ferrovibrio sp. TaxID=1917215 RepID=UPI0035B145A0